MNEKTKNISTNSDQPSALYLKGVNFLHWSFDLCVKSFLIMFFWNNGLARVYISIPRMEYSTSFSILFLIATIVRMIGANLAETAGIPLFLLFQKQQNDKNLNAQIKNNNE